MTNGKVKGNNGEHEFINMLRHSLSEYIPIDNKNGIRRNLDQSRTAHLGDVLGIPDLCIEIKRSKLAKLTPWWSQAVSQALQSRRIPILAYRIDYKPWAIVARLSDWCGESVMLAGDQEDELDFTMQISYEAFIILLKCRLYKQMMGG